MHFFGNHRIARADLHKPPGKPTSLQSAGWAKNNFILTLDVRMSFHMLRVVSNKQFLKLSGLLLQLLLLQKFDKSVASLQGSCSARPRRKPLFLLGPSSGLELQDFKKNTPMCEHLISQLCFSWWMAKWVEGMNTVNQMQWMIHAPKMLSMMILKTVHKMYSSATGQEHKPGHSGVVLLLGDICSGSRTSP